MWWMPHTVLSSRRHVWNTALVASNLLRSCTEVKHRGDGGNGETCVVEIVHKPHQIPILEGFDADFVLRPVQDCCDFSGKLSRGRLESIELQQWVWRGHGDSLERKRVDSWSLPFVFRYTAIASMYPCGVCSDGVAGSGIERANPFQALDDGGIAGTSPMGSGRRGSPATSNVSTQSPSGVREPETCHQRKNVPVERARFYWA